MQYSQLYDWVSTIATDFESHDIYQEGQNIPSPRPGKFITYDIISTTPIDPIQASILDISGDGRDAIYDHTRQVRTVVRVSVYNDQDNALYLLLKLHADLKYSDVFGANQALREVGPIEDISYLDDVTWLNRTVCDFTFYEFLTVSNTDTNGIIEGFELQGTLATNDDDIELGFELENPN